MDFHPNVIEASVFAWGIKPKCRKLASHHIKLGDHDPNTLDRSALMERAKSALTRQLKSVDRAWLNLQPWEVKPESHLGFTSRICIPTNMERIPINMEN